MKRRMLSLASLILVLSAILMPASVSLAQPTTIDWSSVEWEVPGCHTDPAGEPGLGGDHLDLVGDAQDPAAFYSFTSDYAFFRERVVGDPRAQGGGIFRNASWVVLLCFADPPGYDYLISVSGHAGDRVRLYSNDPAGRQVPFVFSPTNTDSAENLLADFSAADHADAQPDGNGYWFVSWAIPMEMLVTHISQVATSTDFETALSNGSLRLYYGTSQQNNNYNKDVLNCYLEASLTVFKEVVNNDGGTATTSDWDIVILDDQNAEVARQTLSDPPDNYVVFPLRPADYTITEDGPGCYEASFAGASTDGTITLELGQHLVVTITNDDMRCYILLEKTVINDYDGTLTQDDFPVFINGQPAVWGLNEVVPGTYTVSEATVSGYNASDWSGDCDPDGSNVTVAPGETAVCSITNYDTPEGYTISGYKYCCAGDECSDIGVADWEIMLTGPTEDDPPTIRTTYTDGSGYYEFTGLPAGTYVVSESLPDTWEACAFQEVLVMGSGAGTEHSDPSVSQYYDNASAAWLPTEAAWQPSAWNATTALFSTNAAWIWESERVNNPIDGDVVLFRHQFVVPGNPTTGELRVTVDNGYEAYLNGTFVGSAQVADHEGLDWQDSLLYQPWVNSSGWQTPETYDISSLLLPGFNTLIVEAGNEYMGPEDGQPEGTINSNPGGLIFEINYELESEYHYRVDFCNAPRVNASSNSPVCEGDTLELHGAPEETDSYHWSGPDGWTSQEQNPIREGATASMSGEYTLSITAQGCSASTTIDITVVASCIVSSDDVTLCSSDLPLSEDDLDFACSGDQCCDHTITIHDGDDDYTIAEFNAAQLGAGSYTYTVECGCPESPCDPVSDTANLTIREPCEAVAPDFAVCEGITLTDDLFIAQGASCDGPECCEITLDYSQVDTSTTGDYEYTVICGCDNSPCPPSQTVGTITVHALPEVDAGDDQSMCDNAGLLTLTGGSPDGGTWSGDHVSGDQFDSDAAIPGDYTITYSYSDPDTGCSNSDTKTVTVHALPTADFSATPTSGTTPLDVEFTNNSTAPDGATIIEWDWDFGNGATSDVANPDGQTYTTGTYTVWLTVTTDQGCSDTTNQTITVTPPPPPPPPPAGTFALAGDPTCFFDIDMLGQITRVRYTCPDGHCLGDYEAEDPSGINFLDLQHWTKVDFEFGGQLSNSPPRWIRMRVSDDPPSTAAGQVAVTPVYDFLGYTRTGEVVNSVIFGQPVGMQLDYDPDALPDNTTSVGIAFWNPDTGEWVVQPQSTGRVAGVGTATADVMHFSSFAVIATTGDAVQEAPSPEPSPTPPPSGPAPAQFVGDSLRIEPQIDKLWAPLTFVTRTGNTVIVTANVQNLGEEAGTYMAELLLDGEVIGSRDVTLDAGETLQVRFVLSGVTDGTYQVQLAGLSGSFTTSREVTWWLIVLVGAIGLGGLTWFGLRYYRKRRLA